MADEALSAEQLARVRQLERHGAASLRALSREHDAEYRASRLRVDGIPSPFAAPHLSVDFSQASLQRSRGVIDSLSLRLRYSDPQLHNALSPKTGFARLVFDVLEQLRCEAKAAPHYQGLRGNLDCAFLEWCHDAHADGIGESDLGILLYTVIHMARARLLGTIEDETAEAIIEATRANLAKIIGKYLYQIPKVREDQRAFAEPAVGIAMALEAMIAESSDGDTDVDSRALAKRHALILPPDWQDDASDTPSDSVGAGSGAMHDSSADPDDLTAVGGYRVFTTNFDSVIAASDMYRAEKTAKRRVELNRLVIAQAVSAPRLARELLPVFATPIEDGWLFGQDEGLIDARRLTQLVSNPAYQQIFTQPREQLHSDTVVSFLIDNSGSMKRQRYAAVAVLVDTFCRAFELAGIRSEVLGFTTADWNGGKAMTAWRKAGKPDDPGRLAEVQHVIYKDADTSWRRARLSMACLLETQHFREGVDGEALIWAYQRLLAREESRRYLVVISDGAPMEAATHHANADGFLWNHLANVSRNIDKGSAVRLGAIGIDLDLSDTYRNSVSLDLSGTLGQASYRVLHELFA
jgi:cobaltochelatase CobT